MIDSNLLVRLRGLHTELKKTLSDQFRNYWNRKQYSSSFDRYNEIRETLATNIPDSFSDAPVATIQDFENNQSILRGDVEQLFTNVEALLDRIDLHQKMFNAPKPAVSPEGIFFAGQTFDAFSLVHSIVKAAKSRIWIIDNYVDKSLFDILTAKQSGVSVDIITQSLSDASKLAGKNFDAQYSGLRIRLSSAFHDRFLCIDDASLYHFGASIKDLAKRAFMFSRIEEQFVVQQLLAEFAKIWSRSPDPM
jgi:hypothetical protein